MMYTRSVHFYEIDQMEIVHHSRYILYFEEARLDAMQQLGFGYERLMEMGLASPVTGISCEYIQPARYPDVLDIQILLRQYDGVRFCFAYEVRRQTDHALLCRGETKHCLIGKAGLPVRIRTHYPEIHALMLRWLEESAQSAASVQ